LKWRWKVPNLRLTDANKHIAEIQRRKLTELRFGEKRRLHLGEWQKKLPPSWATPRYRYFGAIHGKLLIEVHSIDIEKPSFSWKWYKLTKNAVLLLRNCSRQLRGITREINNAHNRDMEYITTHPERPRSELYGSNRFFRQLKSLNHARSKLLATYNSFLDAIRITREGESYYTLDIAVTLPELRAYEDFLRAIRESDLKRVMDARGGTQPGSGAPGFPSSVKKLLDNAFNRYRMAARTAKHRDDANEIPEIAARYECNAKSLLDFLIKNKKSKLSPTRWARSERNKLAEILSKRNKLASPSV
jgi:hypothetical protein